MVELVINVYRSNELTLGETKNCTRKAIILCYNGSDTL